MSEQISGITCNDEQLSQNFLRELVADMMRAAAEKGTEEGHMEMDRIAMKVLRAHGYDKAADIFEAAGKWYA